MAKGDNWSPTGGTVCSEQVKFGLKAMRRLRRMTQARVLQHIDINLILYEKILFAVFTITCRDIENEFQLEI